MTISLLDENKAKWIVLKGDPGYWAVSTLARAGFQRIILPKTTYMTGELPSLEEAGCDKDTMLALWKAEEGGTFLYLCFMRDCMDYLDTAAHIEYNSKRRQDGKKKEEEEANN